MVFHNYMPKTLRMDKSTFEIVSNMPAFSRLEEQI